MAKEPAKMSWAELAQEMHKRPDTFDHLMAWAEMERRRSRYMVISAFAAAVSAVFSAVAAIVAAIVAGHGRR
jgi:hypothetical protein